MPKWVKLPLAQVYVDDQVVCSSNPPSYCTKKKKKSFKIVLLYRQILILHSWLDKSHLNVEKVGSIVLRNMCGEPNIIAYIIMFFRCFLLTPKLLPELEYSEACSILNIMNGPWIEQPSRGFLLFPLSFSSNIDYDQ